MTGLITKVIVVGGGGNLGRYIVSAFDTDPRFTVSILSRYSSCASFPPQITVHRTSENYNEPELVDILRDQDAVVCTIATSKISQQKLIIDAATKARVKRFVPSEFGHDTRNEQAGEMAPFLFKTKKKIVEYLRTKEKEGLSWTAFVTGPLFEMQPTVENRAVQNFLGYSILKRQAMILNGGANHWSTTTLNTVALAVQNAMLAPERTANRYLFIESFRVSQNDILALLEYMSGTPWDTIHCDAEEEKRLALESLSKGELRGMPALMRYVTCIKGFGGHYMEYEESANDLLSMPNESLHEVVRAILQSG
ncbi:isoflavone reductase family protein [Aspergillus bombycis]|uniref:Isoflavone reductase family protein n=1 Tax=Aspergillus bombycis TaxID=109264 RepID=A0A1F8A5X9_9EURO|nr:isoflavone reductase family protein [Aspergillus bombycis]OGM47136.1 isoflavone reductase family protein [Aspergillus bombycis]